MVEESEKEKGRSLTENHKYLLFEKSPIIGTVSEMAIYITRTIFPDIKLTIKKWKNHNVKYQLGWTDYITNEKKTSKPINYKIIAQHLRNNGYYNQDELILPRFECLWLDKSIDLNINFHKFDEGTDNVVKLNDGTPKLQFGQKYPITPSLDREGHFFTSFHPILINKIIKNRQRIVNQSDKALSDSWVLDLRELINDTISLVDITLNTFYIKAQYSPEPSWNFDKSVVGERFSRRLKDKLKWVKQITGNDINIEPEKDSLHRLREIRNHLNHFDPPSLVITIEEAANWLNDIILIGKILIKIRNAVGVLISSDLINFVLQKEVKFNPEPAFSKRLPLNPNTGYYSSVWKEDI
jgi:hypothetical protein